ncbi:PREDICTED: uncharacterized protein LOC18590454 isoform X1 [Theobroma cacao]|uniref:Uncharacterized protein LOC18590454 isoform X1 n=1 Tax=Theobroma cacao TaxID=3641 RepID=A0AB32US55_THECC|nr:PREDICTED: uncharacterized protein LOC18590454 isoform X1 [Theobroma cacao]
MSPNESTQQLNSQRQTDVEVEAGSVARNEDSICSWRPFSPVMSPNEKNHSLNSIFENLIAEQQLKGPENFEVETSSVAQTKDFSPIWISFVTDMLPPGEGKPNEVPQQINSPDQQLNSLAENLTADLRSNSQRDVEVGLRCLQPNRSHLDHEERPSDQASNGRKQRGRKPRVTPVDIAKIQLDQAGASAEACNGQKRIRTEEQENERKRKKNESDRKYRADVRNELKELRKIKPVYDTLMTIASSFGGIDQLESLINGMNSDIHKLQEKEVEYDMFQQGIEIPDRVPSMRANEVQVCGIEEMKSLSDKFKEMEAECHRLQLLKSKYGEIEDIESMLDKFKNMEAESQRLEHIKMLFGGIDEIELEIGRLQNMELQLERHKQMVNQKELDSFQASPGSLQQLEFDHCYRQLQKEADLDRFEQLKSKFGGTEELEFKLDKFHWMEAELHKLEQIKSEFGGVDEMEAEIYRLKEIESQHDKQKELQFFPESPGSLQEELGAQSLDLNGSSDAVSADGISLMSPAAVRGTNTMHDMQYSDVLVTKFMAKLHDDSVVGNVDRSSFKDLDGEPKKVGQYCLPPSLVSTAEDIIKAYGDITKKCKFSPRIIEDIYVLFCAAIKEMGDLSLEQVTEEVMLKWRDAITDADRSACDVEFAMKHLEKIAYGYFGLKAYNDRNSLKQRMTILKAEEEVLRKELEKKANEMKAVKAKEGDLTSERCKVCQEFADQFLDKTISVF